MKRFLPLVLYALTEVALVDAQTPQEADTSLIRLDEMVISANRLPEMRSKVAQQVEVVDLREMQRMNVQSTADLLANSGVVAVQKSQQGGGSPQLRGFEASRVLLVVDGVRMNNLIYRAGHLQNIITIDHNVLERAEILLGPSSTVYGSDALGGVVHLVTKKPLLSDNGDLRTSGSALVRIGSVNDERTAHVDVNVGGRRLASLSSFTFSEFGDLRMGKRTNPALGRSFGLREYYTIRSADNTADVLVTNDNPYVQRFSGYTQYDFLQKVLYQPSERVTHTLNLQLSNSTDVPRYDRLTDPDPATGLRNAEWYYGPQRRLMAAYRADVSGLGFADHLAGTLSYQHIEESRHVRRFGDPHRRSQNENVDVAALTLDFQKTMRQSRLRYGLDIQLNRLTSTASEVNITSGESTAGETRYPDGENSMAHYAFYTTHAMDLTERFTITEGLRLGVSTLHARFVDKTFFPFPFDEVKQDNPYASGNAGIIFRPTSNWKLVLMASTGYRVPNTDDLAKVFDSNAGTMLVVPNPGVRPEKTFNVDLSVSRFHFDRIRLEVTAFYTAFFDAIVMDHFALNGQPVVDYEGQATPVMANQNKRRARVAGLSTTLQGEIAKGFSGEASVNVTQGRILENERIPLDHIPPTFGRVKLTYETGRFSTDLFVNYNGWKRIDSYFVNGEDNERYAPEEGMPSWYTVNARVAWTLNNTLTLQGGVDNLFDLQYRTFSSGINAPGRNLFFAVRLSF